MNPFWMRAKSFGPRLLGALMLLQRLSAYSRPFGLFIPQENRKETSTGTCTVRSEGFLVVASSVAAVCSQERFFFATFERPLPVCSQSRSGLSRSPGSAWFKSYLIRSFIAKFFKSWRYKDEMGSFRRAPATSSPRSLMSGSLLSFFESFIHWSNACRQACLRHSRG